jgi:hypothetical protein
MDSTPTAASALHKLFMLALFGFLAVILAGPVIGLVSVVLSVLLLMLPFAFIGLLLWLPFQALIMGRRIDWGRFGANVRAVAGGLAWAGGGVLRLAGRALGWVGRTVWALVRFVFTVVLDVAAGALAGGVLGIIGGRMHGDADGRVPVAMLIGAGVGLVVSLLRSRGTTKQVTLPEPVLAQAVQPAK